MPEIFRSDEGEYLENVLQREDFRKATNNSRVFYIIQANLDKDRNITKFGIAQDFNTKPTQTTNKVIGRLNQYVRSYGSYDSTDEKKGVKLYFVFKTSTSGARMQGKSRIRQVETELKRYYKNSKLLARGNERVKLAPDEVIKNFNNFWGFSIEPSVRSRVSTRRKLTFEATSTQPPAKKTAMVTPRAQNDEQKKADKDTAYEVDYFVKMRIKEDVKSRGGGRRQVLVQWKPTWEYVNPLRNDLGPKMFKQLVQEMNQRQVQESIAAPALSSQRFSQESFAAPPLSPQPSVGSPAEATKDALITPIKLPPAEAYDSDDDLKFDPTLPSDDEDQGYNNVAQNDEDDDDTISTTLGSPVDNDNYKPSPNVTVSTSSLRKDEDDDDDDSIETTLGSPIDEDKQVMELFNGGGQSIKDLKTDGANGNDVPLTEMTIYNTKEFEKQNDLYKKGKILYSANESFLNKLKADYNIVRPSVEFFPMQFLTDKALVTVLAMRYVQVDENTTEQQYLYNLKVPFFGTLANNLKAETYVLAWETNDNLQKFIGLNFNIYKFLLSEIGGNKSWSKKSCIGSRCNVYE